MILSDTDEYAGEKDEISRDIDVDEINSSNHDVDDPGKETTEYDVIHPSTKSQGNKIFKTENEFYDSNTMKAAGADEKAQTSIDLQRSEIMRKGESHEKTVAHHTLNKMTNKKTVLTESKFMIAEIAETAMRTQTSERHVHWDVIEVWDSGISLHDACQNEQIETGIDVARYDLSALGANVSTTILQKTDPTVAWNDQKDSDATSIDALSDLEPDIFWDAQSNVEPDICWDA